MDKEKLAAEARREYHRQWRQKNKERVKQYNAEYWYRKAMQQNKEGYDGANAND